MSGAKPNTHQHTTEARFLAPRTLQQAVTKGAKKTMVMNGSELDMVTTGKRGASSTCAPLQPAARSGKPKGPAVGKRDRLLRHGEHAKEMASLLRDNARHHRLHTVFSDFCELAGLSVEERNNCDFERISCDPERIFRE